jgi:NADH-quinone oxidoreductase subunit M
MNPLLITLAVPLIGMLLLLLFKKDNVNLIKNTTLGFSILTFCASIGLLCGFDSLNSDFQFYFEQIWMKSFDAGIRFGLDGMSLLLVMLTTFLMPIVVLSSYSSIEKRHKGYYIMLLLLEFALIGVFASLDIFLFYIFWEIILEKSFVNHDNSLDCKGSELF